MRIISAEEVARALDWQALVARLGKTFVQGMEAPPRHHHAMHRPDGEATMLLMPACEADIVSCVPLSSEPLVRGAWLAPGSHLDLVGAFRPSMRETDADCLARSEVYVDTYAGAKGEAGDILQAIDEGAFSFDAVRAELAELLRGDRPGRSSPEAITLFKSVGASLEDLAAAIEVWERLTAV